MIHITGDSHWLYNAILYGIIYWFTKEKTFLHHNIQEMFKVRRKRIQSMIFQLITTTKFSFFTIIPFNSLRKAVFSKLMHTKKRKEKKKKTFSHLLSTNFFIRMGKKVRVFFGWFFGFFSVLVCQTLLQEINLVSRIIIIIEDLCSDLSSVFFLYSLVRYLIRICHVHWFNSRKELSKKKNLINFLCEEKSKYRGRKKMMCFVQVWKIRD